jgi:hypothetical protein
MPYTVKLANDELLTVQSWRKQNSLFLGLPFTTSIPYADENMGSTLDSILEQSKKADSQVKSALTVCKLTFFLFPDLSPVFSAYGYWSR